MLNRPPRPPEVGHKYEPDDVFCYIATPWNTYDRVLANFSGRIIEVCAKQGALVNKGDALAYVERYAKNRHNVLKVVLL